MNQKIKNGIIHCHSEYSIKDSAMSVKTLLKTAKELGAPAVVLTDHGVLSGIYPICKAASGINKEAEANGEDYRIKIIPGVEAYVEEDNDLKHRAHLVLIAKNYKGYQAICKAVTESNKRIDSAGFPRMNKEILIKCFGENTDGHGNVIASSACIGGVLCQIMLQSQKIEKEIEKLKNTLTKCCNPESEFYKKSVSLSNELQKEINDLRTNRTERQKISKKSVSKLEKAVTALEGKDGFEEAKANLDAVKADIEKAKIDISELSNEINRKNNELKSIKAKLKEYEKTTEKYVSVSAEIKSKEKNIIPEKELVLKTEKEAEEYKNIFGDGNFYVELQNHGIEDEVVFGKLALIAEKLNLPTVATNDAHIAKNTSEDRLARQIMRSQRFNQWEEEMIGDEQLYIKTDDELLYALCGITSQEKALKAMNGIGDIISQCNVEFPKDDHYPKFVGHINGETSEMRLRRLALEGIKWRYPNTWCKEYEDRMEYELKTIHEMGYDDYHCIVQDFLNEGRRLGVNNAEGVGEGVGPGRGSAVGSIVCYLTGITSVDPMKHNLFFERYLNTERVSLPDIDSDFHTELRSSVVDFCKNKYGDDGVCCIQTNTVMKPVLAIKSVGRVRNVPLDIVNKVVKNVPKKPGTSFSSFIDDDKKTTVYDYLVNMYKNCPTELQLIENAKIIENTIINYGAHAAGIVIADNGNVGEYVSLAYNKKKECWVCQCVKDEVEKSAHLLKMDFLGLNNLDIITDCERRIKRNYGKSIKMENINIDEPEVYKNIFASGNTNAVFQFESGGMKEMLKKFQPTNIEDIILLVAAYRPGPMQYIPEIIETKHGKSTPNYIIPEMSEVLGTTYGKPIYQEQIQQIFNKFAGFTLGEADIIRRAMSKKHLDELVAYREKFVEGMTNRGASLKDTEDLWNELLNFASYAFNKSHAAAYAYVAYYTAWFKYHYPTEYMAAVMDRVNNDKVISCINECRSLGISVLKPDINVSGDGFTTSNGTIIYGFSNIKNVGSSGKAIIEARNEKPFVNFKDFLLRVPSIKKNALEALIQSGAFDSWCDNRIALLNNYESLKDDIASIGKCQSKLNELNAQLATLSPENKKYASTKRSINLCKQKYEAYKERFDGFIFPINIHEDNLYRLKCEKDLLGFYVSGHPLDNYASTKKYNTVNIDSLECGKQNIVGIIDNYRDLKTKKDGSSMAAFSISDKSGIINAVCFPKAYKSIGSNLQNDAVFIFYGNCDVEEDVNEDGETVYTKKFVVNDIREAPKMSSIAVVSGKSVVDWEENIYPEIKPYIADTGIILQFYDEIMGEIRDTGLLVSTEIFKSDLGFKITKPSFKI